ncbi:MAG TPA: hypothetical protein PLR73_05400 [Acetivibrio sp.]|nr:hypothetical protein [Acetivibrio sp.]
MNYFRVEFIKKLSKRFKYLNKKGISLVEIVLTLALVGIITPIVLAIFTSSLDIYYSYGRYIEQQDNVSDVLSHLRGDIKNAYQYKVEDNVLTLIYSDGTTQRIWKLADSKLKFIDRWGNVHDVVEGIDTANSSFDYSNSEQVIVLKIQPIKTNTGKYTARNYNKPIITEFSVKYKELLP